MIIAWTEFLTRLRESGGCSTTNAFALGGRYPHPCHTRLPQGVTPSAMEVPDSGGHDRSFMTVDGPPGFPGAGGDGESFRAVRLHFRHPSFEIPDGSGIECIRDWSTEDGWRADLRALAYQGGVTFDSSPPDEEAAAAIVRTLTAAKERGTGSDLAWLVAAGGRSRHVTPDTMVRGVISGVLSPCRCEVVTPVRVGDLPVRPASSERADPQWEVI